MEDFINKISLYQILNYIVPGFGFVFLSKIIFNVELSNGQLWNDFILILFCGIIANRVGSVFVEKIYKKIGCVKYLEHEKYLIAEKKR